MLGISVAVLSACSTAPRSGGDVGAALESGVIRPKVHPGSEKEIAEYCGYLGGDTRSCERRANNDLRERRRICNSAYRADNKVKFAKSANETPKTGLEHRESCYRHDTDFRKQMSLLKEHDEFHAARDENALAAFVARYRDSDGLSMVPLADKRRGELRAQRERVEFEAARSEQALAVFVQDFQGDDPANLVGPAQEKLRAIRVPRQTAELADARTYEQLTAFVSRYASNDYANLVPAARDALAGLCRREGAAAANVEDWRRLLDRHKDSGCTDTLLNARTQVYRADFAAAKSLEDWARFVETYATFDPDGRLPAAREALLTAQTALQRERFENAVTVGDWQSFVDTYRVADVGGMLPEAEKRLRAAQTKACLAASIPGLKLLPDETTEYFGECQGGVATTGIVLRRQAGQVYDLGCLANGKYQKPVGDNGVFIDAFKPCGNAWNRLPDYCTLSVDGGTYHGQCKDGAPHGVGIWTRVQTSGVGTSDLAARQGQFKGGKPNGFVRAGGVGACGAAGCTGGYNPQVGWFEQGEHQFKCSDLAVCLANLSGSAYLAYISRPRTDEEKLHIKKLRGENTFASALAAFELTGDKAELKRAEALARSDQDRARFEYTLVRLAGFDNVFKSGGRLSAGGREADINNENALSGLATGDVAESNARFEWHVAARPKSISLKHGTYRLKVVSGISADYIKSTCVLGMCNDRTVKNEYSKAHDVMLTPGNRWQFRQTDEHKLTMAHTASVGGGFLGTGSGRMTGMHPFVRIDAIELVQTP